MKSPSGDKEAKDMKNILFLIGLTVALSCSAQTVYTWVDEDGVLHFSDNPSAQDAEALRLPDVQASAPAPKFEASTPVDTAALPTTKTATQLKIRQKQKPQNVRSPLN